MCNEATFNTTAGKEFAHEYERETGRVLRFVRVGEPFPDAILADPDGREVGVEFVSIVLAFLTQEHSYFRRFRERFLEALRVDRPRYATLSIRLQPSSAAIEGRRPIRLPDVESVTGRALVAEFGWLLENRSEDILRTGAALLENLPSETQPLPNLRKFFDAVLVHTIAADDTRKTHRDDPLIEDPTMMYMTDELARAVQQATNVKLSKGSAYATDFLLLHTLPVPGKPHFPGLGMAAEELAGLGRELTNEDLRKRFKELWLLSDCSSSDGKRLYRL